MLQAIEKIEICLRGEGIIPDNIQASEVTDLIASYEDALLNIIAGDNLQTM